MAHLDRRARREAQPGDEVISLSILHRVGTSQEEREIISASPRGRARRKANARSSLERIAEFEEKEQFILTVCANGYGKRSSAYEYRRTNRGGQGITNIDNSAAQRPRRRELPGQHGEQLMLVTDQAKLIRMTRRRHPRRRPQHAGVTIFSVAEASMSSASPRSRRARRKRSKSRSRSRAAKRRLLSDAVIGESELEKPADPEQE